MESPIKKTINGIDVYYIISNKFKTVTWSLNFMHEAGVSNINEYYFLSNILLDNMKHYPSNEKKYRYLSYLYGLEAFGSAKSLGKNIVNQFVVTYPNELYIKGENDLSVNAFKFLIDIIMNPKMRNGNFTKKVLNDSFEEANQLFGILKSIKDMHAYYNYTKVFYQDKSGLEYNFPEKELLEKVNLETLLKAYKDFFEKDKISIFVTGNIDVDKFDNIIKDNLPSVFEDRNIDVARKDFNHNFEYIPKVIKEYYNVSQSRVFVGYLTNAKYLSNKHAAASVFNDIFGGFDQSLLFNTIREELNLAYYVDSHYLPDEQLVTVSVSCEVKNEDMVVEKIKSILKDIKDGNFTDQIFNQAKDSCVNSLYSINDSQTSYLLQHIKNYQLNNEKYDLETRIKAYQSVTKEDVIRIANNLVLDTVYIYTKKGDQLANSKSSK